MNQIKHITIPTPCHESWQQMTPDGQGRHCLHCSKTVVDFSKMTGDEIIGYLANQTNVCGRFGEQQLTTVNHRLADQNLTGTSYWKKWLIAASVFSAAILNRASAQTAPLRPATTQQQHPAIRISLPTDIMGKIMAADSTRLIKITGRVIGADDKLPVIGASITIKGTHVGTVCDTAGRFSLNIPWTGAVLVAGCIGYSTQEVAVQPATDQPIAVSLVLSPMISGEVVITRRPFYARWYNQFIRRPIYHLMHRKFYAQH